MFASLHSVPTLYRGSFQSVLLVTRCSSCWGKQWGHRRRQHGHTHMPHVLRTEAIKKKKEKTTRNSFYSSGHYRFVFLMDAIKTWNNIWWTSVAIWQDTKFHAAIKCCAKEHIIFKTSSSWMPVCPSQKHMLRNHAVKNWPLTISSICLISTNEPKCYTKIVTMKLKCKSSLLAVH